MYKFVLDGKEYPYRAGFKLGCVMSDMQLSDGRAPSYDEFKRIFSVATERTDAKDVDWDEVLSDCYMEDAAEVIEQMLENCFRNNPVGADAGAEV